MTAPAEDQLAVMGEYLCQFTPGVCTCDQHDVFPHRPECGWEPLLPVAAVRAALDPAPTPMDPRDMHGLALAEGVDHGNWYPYCPACSWDAGEQVGRCTQPVVAAMWPDAAAFVPRSTGADR